MDGFKDSTKMKYMGNSSKAPMAKPAAKAPMAKPAMAKAPVGKPAMAAAPMKKAMGGPVFRNPSRQQMQMEQEISAFKAREEQRKAERAAEDAKPKPVPAPVIDQRAVDRANMDQAMAKSKALSQDAMKRLGEGKPMIAEAMQRFGELKPALAEGVKSSLGRFGSTTPAEMQARTLAKIQQRRNDMQQRRNAVGVRTDNDSGESGASMPRTNVPVGVRLANVQSRIDAGKARVQARDTANRMSRMEAERARAMGLKKGGLAVMPKKGKR